MPRTTVNIDASVLRELKRRQRRESKQLGQLISELLAVALEASPDVERSSRELEWVTRPMRASVDVDDKEALHRALEGR